MSSPILDMIDHGLWAGAAAICFAVLLNVPVRALAACGLTGLLGYETRTLLTATEQVTSAPASLVAAVLVSLFGVACGRKLHAPAVIFVIPGIIPLVPGALAYRTIAGLMSALSATAETQQAAVAAVVENALRTTVITAALATGVALPSMLLRRRRPML